MAFVDTPLTAEVREAVRRHWGIEIDRPERLHGGQESASYRLGDQVVRIGPKWRADVELAWSFALATRVAAFVPEVVAPCPAGDGRCAVRVGGRPVSVWPYVAGGRGDDRDNDQRWQAADLLARLHRALAQMHTGPWPDVRPGPGPEPEPEVGDPELDRWLAAFDARHPAQQPLHGDFHAGNTLVRRGRIVALLDWDDVFLGPPERELAWAAWEWGDGPSTLDVGPAMAFVIRYATAGGTATPVGEEELAQLVRERLRMEVGYNRAAWRDGAPRDADDLEYEAPQLEAFQSLRP
ncbi:MAG: phosphotransferase [Streptosporangiales bacterium]|nr:phosphotransferase [Streptosporangiales bacterium]